MIRSFLNIPFSSPKLSFMHKAFFNTVLSSLLIFLLAACSDKQKSPEIPPVLVEVATSTSETVPDLLELFGTISAINSVDIVPQVSGTLVQTHFNYGEPVQVGDPLFTIDQRSFVAELAKAYADLKAKQAIAKVARDKALRSEPLLPQNLISPQDFETLLAQADQAQQDVIAAEANLALAEINLGYTAILSPLKGVTGVKTLSNGDYMEAGKTNMLTINQMDPIQVNIFVPATSFTKVQKAFSKNQGKLSLSVKVLDDLSGTSMKGYTSFFDNNINTNTGTFELQGIIPNSNLRLWVGQYVRASLELGMIEDAVLAPQSAVSIGPKGPYIFVINDEGTANFRLVKTGEVIGNNIVIYEGLKAGEIVVTLGQLKLREGSKVKIINNKSQTSTPKTPPKAKTEVTEKSA